jgi:hypothetical protein
MAKDNPNTQPKKPKEPTPFEKFDRLAKRIIRVPKAKADERKATCVWAGIAVLLGLAVASCGGGSPSVTPTPEIHTVNGTFALLSTLVPEVPEVPA